MMKSALLTVALAFAGTLVVAGGALAAKGMCKDGTPPPCKPGGGEDPTAVNHLSYPAVLIPSSAEGQSATFQVGTVFGQNYSYGCAKEQVLTIGGTAFTYPNTTCAELDDQGEVVKYLSAAECNDSSNENAPCAGLPVDRIYWQKVSNNQWNAQTLTFTDGTLAVSNVDWGDSLEAVTWNENSVLRVEVQPYYTLPAEPVEGSTLQGLQMWHVAGQGITEQWGVRAAEGEKILPYVYPSSTAIINAGTADLYLSKLAKSSATCPTAGGDPGDDPPADTFSWTGAGWSDTCTLPVVPFTVELSVGGKYVHGYNWRMRELSDPLVPEICGVGWQKAGWWRLTYVPNGGSIDKYMEFTTSTKIVPPDAVNAVPTDLSELSILATEEETTDTLYKPVVDATHNLTYIDICIDPKAKGGGGGGKNKNQ